MLLLLLTVQAIVIVDGWWAAAAAVGNANIALAATPLSMMYKPSTRHTMMHIVAGD